MKEILPNNKGKKTTSQEFAKGTAAALQQRRLIRVSQISLGNSTCQLSFITFSSPFSWVPRGIALTIDAWTPHEHRWLRRKIIAVCNSKPRERFVPFQQIPPPSTQSLAQKNHKKRTLQPRSWRNIDGFIGWTVFSRSRQDFISFRYLRHDSAG